MSDAFQNSGCSNQNSGYLNMLPMYPVQKHQSNSESSFGPRMTSEWIQNPIPNNPGVQVNMNGYPNTSSSPGQIQQASQNHHQNFYTSNSQLLDNSNITEEPIQHQEGKVAKMLNSMSTGVQEQSNCAVDGSRDNGNAKVCENGKNIDLNDDGKDKNFGASDGGASRHITSNRKNNGKSKNELSVDKNLQNDAETFTSKHFDDFNKKNGAEKLQDNESTEHNSKNELRNNESLQNSSNTYNYSNTPSPSEN